MLLFKIDFTLFSCKSCSFKKLQSGGQFQRTSITRRILIGSDCMTLILMLWMLSALWLLSNQSLTAPSPFDCSDCILILKDENWLLKTSLDWTNRGTNKQRLAFLELLSEPKRGRFFFLLWQIGGNLSRNFLHYITIIHALC